MIVRWLGLIVAALCCVGASADSWLPPSKESYMSPDGATRLTVTPRSIDSPGAYFEDKVAGKAPAGQADGETKRSAAGLLERKGPGGRWTKIWQVPLINEVAPVHALVANGGQRVVTFDNWHSVGLGPQVVVIYGADGTMLRAFALRDLLPPVYLKALPRSVSSLWWGGEHRLSADGARLLLAIVVPDDNAGADPHETVEIAIDLTSVSPIAPAGAAWGRALKKASQVAKARDDAAAAERAAFIAPLIGPAMPDERAWHGYLQEAFFRLDPEWKDGFPSTTVLRATDAKDYRPSEKWLHDAFGQLGDMRDVLSLATLAPPEHFLEKLEQAVRAVKPGRGIGARVYVAIDAAWKDRVAATLALTGARFIHLDPALPIHQRPERLERLFAYERAAAADEAADAVAAEAGAYAVGDALMKRSD